MDELEIFGQFFDSSVFTLIIEESVRYARQKNDFDFNLDDADIKNFIGILILSGYNRLPRQRMYWESGLDCGVEAVKNTMSYTKFTKIKKYVHLCDNNSLSRVDKRNDHLFKVRNYVNLMNKNFQKFGYFSKYLSIEEQMITYYGHHSSKMFIKGKPVRFGFKCWCFCSYHGYVFSTDIHCGKGTSLDNKLGLGGMLLINLLILWIMRIGINFILIIFSRLLVC